jgi:hypothetical protein
VSFRLGRMTEKSMQDFGHLVHDNPRGTTEFTLTEAFTVQYVDDGRTESATFPSGTNVRLYPGAAGFPECSESRGTAGNPGPRYAVLSGIVFHANGDLRA